MGRPLSPERLEHFRQYANAGDPVVRCQVGESWLRELVDGIDALQERVKHLCDVKDSAVKDAKWHMERGDRLAERVKLLRKIIHDCSVDLWGMGLEMLAESCDEALATDDEMEKGGVE